MNGVLGESIKLRSDSRHLQLHIKKGPMQSLEKRERDEQKIHAKCTKAI